MAQDLKDKHFIVTGGGTGTGVQIAHDLSGAGARVTIMGRTEASLKDQGLSYQICDVTRTESVQEAFESARRDHGPIAGVVANAGASESAPFAKMDPDVLTRALAVNLIGVSQCWQAGLPDMLEAGWGRLIAICSTAGLKGYAYVSAYCAAKHGVVGLTRAVALEVARKGITANAICPGFIETPMLSRSIDKIRDTTGMDESDARATLARINPQNRFFQSDEVAGAALYLSSDAARGVNGSCLTLSGGEV